MMRRRLQICFMALIAMGIVPATAADAVLAVHNNASVAVEQIVVFHLDTDGSVIDDVVGGRFEPLAAGARAKVAAGPCGPSSIYVRLANGRELAMRMDTCRTFGLAIRD